MQFFINGLISGSAIALLALAFQLVLLPTRVFFIGLAGIYSLAPFVALSMLQAGWGWATAITVTVLVSSGLSLLIEWANHAPLARKEASEAAHLITSLGIYIIIVQAVAITWGSRTKTLPTSLASTTHIAEVIVTEPQWVVVGVASALILSFSAFLMYSDIGLRLRALADNPAQFALLGYNINSHRLLAFGLSGGFAAASSLVTAYDVGFDPYVGLQAVLLAMVAVIIGGRGSFAGPVVGALILGVLRAGVVWYFSAHWQEAVTFALLAVFLLLRPQGLLGRETRIEAAY